MRKQIAAFGTSALLALAIAAPAGASLDIMRVNSGEPGAQSVPAFSGVETAPANRALYAGTCDLNSATTENGGVGASNGGIDPPAIRAHCIDVGANWLQAPWELGQEPRWRLDPVTQAGGHPDATAAFWFKESGEDVVDGSVKNIVVKLPPGVVGSPTATPQCSSVELQSVPTECDARTQVGISSLGFSSGICTIPETAAYCGGLQTYGVYNVEARDTVTAEFYINGVSNLFNIPITARGRTNGDYGVDTLALLIPEFATIGGQAFTFWGVPWAAEHDKFRIEAEQQNFRAWNIEKYGYAGGEGQPSGGYKPISYDPSWGPIEPFFTNPTECRGASDAVVMEMDSWQDPASRGGQWIANTTFAPPITGCEKLEFNPAITLKPTVSVADSPSGVDVLLETPQNDDAPEAVAHDPADDTGAPAYWRTAAGLATAHLKDTVVRLPAGTSFNPAAANGLLGCTTEQIGLTATSPRVTFNNDKHQCPDESKIGTMKVISPLLPDPLIGEVFAAPQYDNPFPGTLTSIYLVAQDEERGLSVKLPGRVDLDSQTGQISTTFLDNPRLPFDSFELHFETGPRAPLNNPATCGQFKNSVSLTPWSFPHSGPESVIEDPFPIASMPNGLGCVTEPEDRTFGPGFEAGATKVKAGSHTDFVLNVSREDGHQEVSAIGMKLPPGLTANLTETPYCPEHQIEAARQRTGLEERNSPSCPAVSHIGTVTALAGAGSQPLPTTGNLYLAGPFDPDGAGPQPVAPISVVAVTPAIAGGTQERPAFDLGNVVIRSAGYVDRRTAEVTVASTRVPYIVGGVPLRIRKIMVAIEKPSFMLNPTSCAEMSVTGSLGGAADPLDGADDTAAQRSTRFQVGGCKELGFKPKLRLRLIGGTKRAKYQRLKATLTARPGDANISRAEVVLPRSSFLAQEHIRTICTRAQFAQNTCPPGSVYGKVTAYTPLLKDPLSGPVYLRSSDNPLPDMVAKLSGQIEIELVGRIDSYRKGIRSTFDIVPDAPVSKFELEMFGGKRSLIVNSRNLCKSTNRATLRFSAHNGLSLKERPKTANSCKRRKGKGK